MPEHNVFRSLELCSLVDSLLHGRLEPSKSCLHGACREGLCTKSLSSCDTVLFPVRRCKAHNDEMDAETVGLIFGNTVADGLAVAGAALNSRRSRNAPREAQALDRTAAVDIDRLTRIGAENALQDSLGGRDHKPAKPPQDPSLRW